MALTLNSSVFHRALAHAHAGQIDHGEWSAPDGKDRDAENCIGHDESAAGTEGEHKYPILSGGKVAAKGVGSALGYAEKNNEHALIGPLRQISAAIRQHGTMSAGSSNLFYLPPLPGHKFNPSEGLGEGYPRTLKVKVGDKDTEIPVTYLDKVIAVTGDWVRPEDGAEYKIDADRLANWASTFDRMNADGIKVFVCSDHPPNGVPNAKNNRGYIVRMWTDTAPGADGKPVPALHATHQFIGADAPVEALRNNTSIGFSPDYIGTNGVHYGDAIVHNALTPDPVSTGLTPFTQTASRASSAASASELIPVADRRTPMHQIPCSEEHMSAVRKLIPGGDNLTPEDLMSRVVQHLHTMSAMDDDDAGGPSAVSTMSRSDIHERAKANRKSVRDQLAAKNAEAIQLADRVQTMSRQIPQPLGEEAESALVDAASTKFAAAVGAGAIDPGTRDRLLSLLVKGADGKVNVVTMSRASNPRGDRALTLAIADILLDNKPVPLGSHTVVQTMSRNVPGQEEKKEDKNPWTETAEKMYGKKG